MPPLAGLFIAIIAVNALLQAALLLGLVIRMRMLNRSLDELESHVEQEVRPRMDQLGAAAARLAEAAEAARAQAFRVDAALAAHVGGIRRRVGRTIGRVGEAAQDAAAQIDEPASAESEAASGWAWSLLGAALRGFVAWSESRTPNEPQPAASSPDGPAAGS